LAAREIVGTETYPLPCNITVFLGKDEELIPEQVDGWKRYTSGDCTIHFFNGGHFFINEKVEEVLGKINITLQCISKPIKL